VVREHFDHVFKYIIDHDMLSDRYMLNVNFPSRDFNTVKGIKVTELGFRPVNHFYEKNGDHHYTSKRRFLPFDFIEGTDLHAVRNGYVSITPLQFTNHTDEGLTELRKKVSADET
jgi:5'-nucleotidase